MPGFTAGLISQYGLLRWFSTTSERAKGTMTVPNLTDWVGRLVSGASAAAAKGTVGTAWAGIPPGPSNDELSKEWWAVWNYLTYGVGGVVVGATGDTLFTTMTVSTTPLHSTNDKINVVIGGGNAFSNEAAANLATNRGDCFAVVGNYARGITQPVATSYAFHSDDFGFGGYTGNTKKDGTTGNNVIYCAGRKVFFTDWDGSGRITTDKLDTASDVAGNIGKATTTYNSWSIPVGFKKGQINGVVALEQSFSNTDSQRLQDNGVNPVMTYPGKGSYFMGNSTGAAAAGSTFTNGYFNVMAIITYIKGEVKAIANDYLFEPNTDSNRSDFINRASILLDGVKSSGTISTYSIICPPGENIGQTFSANIAITPVNVAETITLKVTNNTTTEVFTL